MEIFKDCGKLFLTGSKSELFKQITKNNILEQVQIIHTISANWTDILVLYSDNSNGDNGGKKILKISDFSNLSHPTRIDTLDSFSESPTELCIASGTSPKGDYFVYSSNVLYRHRDQQVMLTTELPIISCKSTSEFTMVVCGISKSGKYIQRMKEKLWKCVGFLDISVRM